MIKAIRSLFGPDPELVEARKAASPLGVERGHLPSVIRYYVERIKELETEVAHLRRARCQRGSGRCGCGLCS